MEILIEKTETCFNVTAKQELKKLSLSFSFHYLGKEEAEEKAKEFYEYIKRMIIFGWKELECCFERERLKRDKLYFENGKGIVESSGKKCFSVYFRYITGRSPNFRMQFSKMQFGAERALNLAKRFQKDFFELENDIHSNDDHVEKLIEKYDKIKMEQELINIAAERRRKLLEFRAKKNDR